MSDRVTIRGLLQGQHPRYLSLILLVTFGVFTWWYNPPYHPSYIPHVQYHVEGHLPSLGDRLARSEALWERGVEQRHELIRRFGPRPSDVVPFPVDPPWPPYTLWDFFLPSYNCPHEVERIGTAGDGGKWICGFSRVQQKSGRCVVYSVGINHESSFEADILERAPHCEVWGYDFSVQEFGPEVQHRQDLLPRAHFSAFGLSGKDAHGPGDDPPMYTLKTLMSMNGHSFIDILKIDIESWEFPTLMDLLHEYKGRPLPFGQLSIEIHVWDRSFPDMLKWWEALEEAGLRAFWTEPNIVYANYNRGREFALAEYSFINVRGHHDLISNGAAVADDAPLLHLPPK